MALKPEDFIFYNKSSKRSITPEQDNQPSHEEAYMRRINEMVKYGLVHFGVARTLGVFCGVLLSVLRHEGKGMEQVVINFFTKNAGKKDG